MATCAQLPEALVASSRIAERAHRAFNAARKLPAWHRMAALHAAADAVEQKAEEFATLIATEGIKTIREASIEVRRAVETLRISAEECRRNAGEIIRFDQARHADDRFGWWVRRPLGVVLAITPYNDPLNLVAHKLGPAIAAGAPIIVKPHPATVGTASLLADCFEGSNLPDSMIQIAAGDEMLAQELAGDPRVAVVSFTGGRKGGIAVAASAGLKRIIAELGGVCTAVVDSNVDLSRAAPALVSGFFWAAGQNCVHTQRALIHSSLYLPLVEQLVDQAQAVRIGDQLDTETDVGPLVDERQAMRVETLVESAIAAGARLLCGGQRHGRFYEPTLLSNVPLEHALWTDEVFGPVAALAPFETLEEAVRLVNEAGPSINAALFTDSLASIMAFQDDVLAGSVIINDSTDFRIDAMPFGGNGQAGLGREGVRNSIEALTEAKVISLRP